MRKSLFICLFASALFFSCNTSGTSSDNNNTEDSVNTGSAADEMIQDSLNSNRSDTARGGTQIDPARPAH